MSLLFLYHVFQVKLCITLFMHTLNFLLTSSVSVRWRTAKEWCPLTFDIFHMNFLLLMNQFRNMNALWVNVCYWWNQIKQGLWPSPVHIQEHELIFLKFLQPMLNTITFPIFIPVFFFTASTQITQQQWSSFVQAWMYVSISKWWFMTYIFAFPALVLKKIFYYFFCLCETLNPWTMGCSFVQI